MVDRELSVGDRGHSPHSHAVFHDQPYPPERRNVPRGIALHRYQVGQRSGPYLAPVSEVEDGGVTAGGGTERFEGRHAALDHGFQLTHVITMGEDADVPP